MKRRAAYILIFLLCFGGCVMLPQHLGWAIEPGTKKNEAWSLECEVVLITGMVIWMLCVFVRWFITGKF